MRRLRRFRQIYRVNRRRLIGVRRALMGARAPLPGFLIIGAQKAGTSSLFATVAQHPRIAPPYVKELNFFGGHFVMGKWWYRAMLDRDRAQSDPPPITFEATPSYFSRPAVVARIEQMLPETKFVLMLRRPVDRAVSNYYYLGEKGIRLPPIERVLIDEAEFIEPFLDRPWPEIAARLQQFRPGGSICVGSLYAPAFEYWLSRFPRERFLVVRSEDYFADQQDTADRIFRFINVPAFKLPQQFHILRGSYAPLDPETYARLDAFFRRANHNLPDLAGDEFHWE